ncbi:timeless protein-domain-containing protein [Multifurca ochricompacta]|uniref:Timeless protein-domain-containing protein n=1 Tax=Multifurca ochricompacta TaxID=376703 RepID=A0AAD4QK87_9AGAM|nr:timeless protein-domain-containing protein [Multifurca ochricompacta]
MADGDDISISSGEGQQDEYTQRRAILEPAILNVVNALGGYENGVYRLGDEVYGCLKDLKKYWRKDDTDDERTVARILWASRVLPNDLIPIILETAGKGHVEDKRAIACIDLITAMTWPIDLAEELKELDEELDRGTDYTQLLQSHLHYKAALLRTGVLQAFFGIILPCLARSPKTRTERDVQIVNVVLHVLRNLAFIRDLPANVHLSTDQAEFASLQSKLIRTLSESHFFDLLLTIASSAASDVMFNNWNTLVLEILYLLFRGVKPTSLVLEQTAQTKQNLRQLLTVEDKRRKDFARNAPSRHSRFGTTISVRLNPKKATGTSDVAAEGDTDNPIAPDTPSSSASTSQPFVLHRQQALSKEPGAVIDLIKRQNKQKGKKEDEFARDDNLTPEARTVLRGLARTFIESCFNPFLASLLKDIKSERPKITEKDNLRLLFVTKWFLEYFIAVRAQEKSVDGSNLWAFGLVGEVIERGWIVWVLKRMNGAVEAKPKLWTELQAGIECLTQLLVLLEAMASPDEGTSGGTELHEAADLLQQQIVYNGQVLDAALDGLRVYKDGTQSLTFLSASVHLAYALMRMLERWAKKTGDGSYVRKRAKPKRKQKTKGRNAEGPDGVPDVEVEEEEEPTQAGQEEGNVIEETVFTFDSFELKFANSDITQSLLIYLGRYKEFTSIEEMKRVVSLLHRQAVRAKAEGLFFQVSALNLFKIILADHGTFPKDQPYKDLVALINYILRQFFKAVEADSFVLIEAFFPKNRNKWKRYSNRESQTKTKTGRTGDAHPSSSRFPPDVRVKKGFSWSEELAISMAALQEAGQGELVKWVKEILVIAIAQRRRIVEQNKNPALDGSSDDDGDEAIGNGRSAKVTITNYMIPYTNDAQAEAATKNPRLKLMFRLVHFRLQDENVEELEWFIPAGIPLSDLQRSLAVIEQFEQSPLDLGGKRASQLLSKKRGRGQRKRRLGSTSGSSDQEGEAGNNKGKSNSDEEDEENAPRKARKEREQKAYKSAQFIEDSDEEYEQDIDEFFAREAELRERTALAAVDSALNNDGNNNNKIGNMRTTGTKKRRRATQQTDDVVKTRVAKRRAVDADMPPGELEIPSESSSSGGRKGGGENDTATAMAAAAVSTPGEAYRSSLSPSGGGGILGSDDNRIGTSEALRLSKSKSKSKSKPKPRPRYRGDLAAFSSAAVVVDGTTLTGDAYIPPDTIKRKGPEDRYRTLPPSPPPPHRQRRSIEKDDPENQSHKTDDDSGGGSGSGSGSGGGTGTEGSRSRRMIVRVGRKGRLVLSD